MCRCSSVLFKGMSFCPYLSNTVLKVIFELASRILFEDEVGRKLFCFITHRTDVCSVLVKTHCSKV